MCYDMDMMRVRKPQPTYTITLSVALISTLACGSESDLQTRKQEGAGNSVEAKPAQEQRGNHSEQVPGKDDEHGTPSTKTLVQWRLDTDSSKTPAQHALSVVLTVGGTQTAIEAGSTSGTCSVQPAQGGLGRIRCLYSDTGHDVVMMKEGRHLTLYRKRWNPQQAGEAKEEKVATIALAPGTKVAFNEQILRAKR